MQKLWCTLLLLCTLHAAHTAQINVILKQQYQFMKLSIQECFAGQRMLEIVNNRFIPETDIIEIKRLVKEYPLIVNVQDNDGYSCLYFASWNGYTEVVKLLLAAGASVDMQDDEGTTALMEASGYGYLEIVKLLVDAHASLDIQNAAGITALINAVEGAEEGVEIDCKCLKIVQLFINSGAFVDRQNNEGTTALMKAVEQEHIEIIKLLLLANPSVDTQNNDGVTALMKAANEMDLQDSSKITIIKLLVAINANPHIQNSKDGNKTARDYAIDKKIYDAAVEQGLKLKTDIFFYKLRKVRAEKIIEETLISVLAIVISDYAYDFFTPEDLPEVEVSLYDMILDRFIGYLQI